MAATLLGTSSPRGPTRRLNTMSRLNKPLHKALAPVFTGAGVLHVVTPEPFDSIVPPQLPGPARFYTYASGVAELAVALLIANPATRRIGGMTCAALLLAVWPANIYMAWQWRDKPLLLQLISIGRLPVQVPLILAAWGISRR